MQKWEYKAGYIDNNNFEKSINKWGEEGWELIIVKVASDTAVTVVFKRPVKD